MTHESGRQLRRGEARGHSPEAVGHGGKTSELGCWDVNQLLEGQEAIFMAATTSGGLVAVVFKTDGGNRRAHREWETS